MKMKTLFLILGLLFASQSWAATNYYVATNGNDNNPGTEAQPFQTVPKGLRTLQASDTLFIRAGTHTFSTYGNSAGDTLRGGTTWETATYVKPYPNETFTLKGGINMDTAIVGAINYFIFDGSGGTAISDGTGLGERVAFRFCGETNHVRVTNWTVRFWEEHGISSCDGSTTAFNEILNNLIRFNGDGTEPQEHGIYIASGQDYLIKGNQLYDNACYGIHIYSSVSGANQRHRVHGNLVRDNGRLCKPAKVTSGGIIVAAGTGHEVVGNVVLRNGIGIQVDHGGTVTAKVYNNTVVDNVNEGIQLGAASNKTEVKNNIFWNNGGVITDLGSATVKSDNRCSTSVSGCSATGDPLFADAGIDDYSLRIGSPARDGGVNVGFPCNAGCAQGAFDPPELQTGEVGLIAANKIRLTFANAFPPLTANNFVTGWSTKKALINNPITSAVLIGSGTLEITTLNNFVTGDSCHVSYLGPADHGISGGGTLYDATRVGDLWDQAFLARTDFPCTNNITGAPGIVLTQSRYRIRELYGSETAAGWKAGENTAYQVIPGGAFRVRIKAKATGGDPAGFNIAIQRRINGATWAALPSTCSPTNLVCMFGTTPSISVSHGTATTEQLTSEHSNVACAVILTTAWPFVDLGQDTELECEGAVKLDPSISPKTLLEFRLAKDDGTAFDVCSAPACPATLTVIDHQFIDGAMLNPYEIDVQIAANLTHRVVRRTTDRSRRITIEIPKSARLKVNGVMQ